MFYILTVISDLQAAAAAFPLLVTSLLNKLLLHCQPGKQEVIEIEIVQSK